MPSRKSLWCLQMKSQLVPGLQPNDCLPARIMDTIPSRDCGTELSWQFSSKEPVTCLTILDDRWLHHQNLYCILYAEHFPNLCRTQGVRRTHSLWAVRPLAQCYEYACLALLHAAWVVWNTAWRYRQVWKREPHFHPSLLLQYMPVTLPQRCLCWTYQSCSVCLLTPAH